MTSHRKIRLSLDPFAIIFPKVAPRHKLSSQQNDDDGGQEELHETPKPNLDFGSRVWFLRSDLLPPGELFVPLAFTCGPFLVFLLLLVPVFLVPDRNKISDHHFEREADRKRRKGRTGFASVSP